MSWATTVLETNRPTWSNNIPTFLSLRSSTSTSTEQVSYTFQQDIRTWHLPLLQFKTLVVRSSKLTQYQIPQTMPFIIDDHRECNHRGFHELVEGETTCSKCKLKTTHYNSKFWKCTGTSLSEESKLENGCAKCTNCVRGERLRAQLWPTTEGKRRLVLCS